MKLMLYRYEKFKFLKRVFSYSGNQDTFIPIVL